MRGRWFSPLFAPDGAGGGGGGGAGGAAAGGAAGADGGNSAAGAGGDGQSQGQQGQSPSAYRPEGLPDNLFGTSDRETIDKLYTSVQGFRRSQAERGEVPQDLTGYGFKPSEKIAPFMGDVAKDPVIKIIADAAIKNGVTTKQFGPVMNSVLEALVDGNMIEDPWNAETEMAALLPDIADPAERAKEVDRRVRDNSAFLDTLETRGMPKESIAMLKGGLDRAAQVKAIEWFRTQMGETVQPKPNGGGTGGGMSAAALRERNADPRNQPGNAKYDAAFAAETTRLYQATYGDGDANRA